jgi:hypothetical protein
LSFGIFHFAIEATTPREDVKVGIGTATAKEPQSSADELEERDRAQPKEMENDLLSYG